MENNVLDNTSVEVENTVESEDRDLIEFLCRLLAVLWEGWPKPMDATLIDEKQNKFSLGGTCPHCNRGAVFMCVTSTHVRKTSAVRMEWAAAMQCPGCQRYVLGVVERSGTRLEYRAHYPLGAPDDSVDESVPEDIASDFSEAMRCLWVKSYKATVAMCRRSVEASCHQLKAEGSNLFKRIDDLAKKGIITEPLRQMAHRVRLVANEELHGKGGKKAVAGEELDDLATFGERDAKAMIAFVREYLHHVYVMPALLKAYEEPEAASGGTPPASTP